MRRLDIYIEIAGKQLYVGEIEYNNVSDARFRYDGRYAESSLPAVSLRMPVRKEAFSPRETRCFFEGLLPEGFHRRTVAQRMHVKEEDYLSILSGLGDECLGAIRVVRPGAISEDAFYEPLSEEQLSEFAEEGPVRSADMLTKSHLSLAGASGKAGLYYDTGDGRWYLPRGEAPSTHIVKQCHLRYEEIVTNERLCLLTAARLGIEVPESFLVDIGSKGRGVLFATKRYDRVFDKNSGEIGGKKRPYRLHQEDFAQALGILVADKYEPDGGEYLKAAFRLLYLCTADPIADQIKLWDILVYDYLVGNTDNHLKNISLLYDKDMGRIRLAPAYDIVSTAVYEDSSRDMAMSVGGRYSLDDIGADAFAEEAAGVGLGVKMAMERFDKMCGRFEEALSESAYILKEQGFSSAGEMADRIKKSVKR